MPIEMPKGLPFSVDTWSPKSNQKRHHFLTHAHKDHLASIASHASFPIYCSTITRSLVLHLFPQIDGAVFVDIEVGKTVVVRDLEGDFTVTAFDANHCPGAVMFLFEGEFGSVLHTGDCRLSDDCLQNLPLKYIAKKKKENVCHLDYLFLDCTFGRCPLKVPSKQSAIRQVINCIWKHPMAPNVYLASDLLGQEDILMEVCKTFGSKLYVDRNILPEFFQALKLIAPDILSDDTTCRFQVIEGFPRLCERASTKLAEMRARLLPEPLFIRPSAQWYACDENQGSRPPGKPNLEEAIKDEFGIWHVCYSMHSSRSELESSLRVLQPKWVISTTPSCRAMELDYVKKHCYKTHITKDDPLWKLLKIGGGKAASSLVPKVPKAISSTVEVSVSIEETQSKLEAAAVGMEAMMNSPPKEIPITLFGRARLGLQEPYYVFRESKKLETFASSNADCLVSESKTLTTITSSDADDLISESKILEVTTSRRDTEQVPVPDILSLKPAEDASICNKSQASLPQDENSKEFDIEKCRKGSDSKGDFSYALPFPSYSSTFKKMFRSRNVPVPPPLPSLMDLMNSSKRARVGSWNS